MNSNEWLIFLWQCQCILKSSKINRWPLFKTLQPSDPFILRCNRWVISKRSLIAQNTKFSWSFSNLVSVNSSSRMEGISNLRHLTDSSVVWSMTSQSIRCNDKRIKIDIRNSISCFNLLDQQLYVLHVQLFHYMALLAE